MSNTPKYKIEFLFNDLRIEKETNDIAKTILEVKPEQLFSEVYINLTHNEDVIERRLNLIDGRKLFNDEQYLEIFINNLLIS